MLKNSLFISLPNGFHSNISRLINNETPRLGRWDFKPMITNRISTFFKRREVVEVQVIQQPRGSLRNYLNPFHSNKLFPKSEQYRNNTATKPVLMGLPTHPSLNQKQKLSLCISQDTVFIMLVPSVIISWRTSYNKFMHQMNSYLEY